MVVEIGFVQVACDYQLALEPEGFWSEMGQANGPGHTRPFFYVSIAPYTIIPLIHLTLGTSPLPKQLIGAILSNKFTLLERVQEISTILEKRVEKIAHACWLA